MLTLLAALSFAAPPSTVAGAPALAAAPTDTPATGASVSEAAVPRAATRVQRVRNQTDYTAYTLGLGEVRVGLGSVGIGVLPRTHVQTAALLDAAGIANAEVKVNPIRAGGFDLAVVGGIGGTSEGSLDATYLSAGTSLSMRVTPAWGVHAQGRWTKVSASGTPDLDGVASLLTPVLGSGPSAVQLEALEGALAMDARAEVVVIRVATDVKLGDRNALILHGWSAVWSSVDAPRYVERVLPDHTGYMGIDEVSSVGIAWQYSSRNFDLRLGVGVSTLPYVWLADSVELAWRFGGPRIPSKTAAARPSGSVGANG